MKYETPELTALTTAINAVQSSGSKSILNPNFDGVGNEVTAAYTDWE